MTDLTIDDIATLLDALKAWETKDFGTAMLVDMVSLISTKEGTPEREKAERQRSEEQAKRERAQRVREDRSVVLRAKLIAIRQARELHAIEQAVTTSAVQP